MEHFLSLGSEAGKGIKHGWTGSFEGSAGSAGGEAGRAAGPPKHSSVTFSLKIILAHPLSHPPFSKERFGI